MAPKQQTLRELALFAGAGGGILGGKLLGWRTVCAVEIEPYCREVLMRRQNEGHLEPFPIWDDVRTFDGRPWNGLVDVVSGGFPCQDIPVAGKGAGIGGERSGLWKEFARIIGEVRPRFAFVENSPALVRRGLGTVLGDLAAMGYDARWGVVSAADCGAPHLRERVWIVANAAQAGARSHNGGIRAGTCRIGRGKVPKTSQTANATKASSAGMYRSARQAERPQRQLGGSSLRADVPNTNKAQRQGRELPGGSDLEHPNVDGACMRWPDDPAEIPESGVGRVVDGVANRVDRLAAIGNGQVPIVAATAWRILSGQ